MYKKILIAVAPDYSGPIDELLGAARALASPGAEIEALSVVSAIPTYIEVHVPKSLYQDSANDVRASLEAKLEGNEDISAAVEIGKPSEEIEKFQKRNGHDLIILRSHNPTVKDYIIGSTSSRVVGNAQCSVHVIR